MVACRHSDAAILLQLVQKIAVTDSKVREANPLIVLAYCYFLQ